MPPCAVAAGTLALRRLIGGATLGADSITGFETSLDVQPGGADAGDADADGLADAWETEHLGTLDHGPDEDPDDDWFSNAREQAGGTDPDNANSYPAGVPHRFTPVGDGDPETSEFAFGGSSGINTVAFIRSGLTTVGDRQFLTYYGRHETDSGYAFNDTIWIARRTVDEREWEVFRSAFAANNINDGHDVISSGIDGGAFLNLSWGMHGDAFHYSRSTTPVTGAGTIVMGPGQTMTGNEGGVTDPQFLTLPDGDLLCLFRGGGSGSGDTYLNRYDTATQAWSNVHLSGSSQAPFIKGRGWSPDYNAYPNQPCLDAAGNLFLTWTWRYNSNSPAGESGYQTNHNFAHARSDDEGVTWRRQDGTVCTLPISEAAESGDENTRAERVVLIPEGYSLMNQAGMCLDDQGKPVVANWWAPETGSGNFRRQ